MDRFRRFWETAFTEIGNNLNVGCEEGKAFIVTSRILAWMMGSVAITDGGPLDGSGASVDKGAQKSKS